jgi:hypothetical protein
MYMFDIGGLAPYYTFDKLNGVWRTAFALGIPVILFAMYYRWFFLKARSGPCLHVHVVLLARLLAM